MGSVFRRPYRDKATGKTKRVRTYSLKFRNLLGEWVTQPTEAVQKHIALRLLRERELQVQQQRALESLQATTASTVSHPEGTNSPTPSAAVPLDHLRNLYLPSIRVRLKHSTAKMYGEVLNFLLPRLSVETASGLTLQRIEQVMQERLQAGTAPRTINIQIAVLNRMLSWAQKQGIIACNLIADWQPLRETPCRKRRAMLPEEVRKLLAAAPVHRRVVYATFLATGVRRSELLQLELSDLDLDGGVLVVRAELTKSGKTRRVFLPRGLMDLLRKYLARDAVQRRRHQDAYLARIRRRLAALESKGKGDSGTAERLRYLEDVVVKARGHRYLFVNGKGLPIRRNCNLLREFRKDLKKAGINSTGLDLHALRHTTNTTLLRGGVNPSIVRARLGHSTSRMTEVYLDKDALDQGGETAPIAELLGVPDGESVPGDRISKPGGGRGLTLETEEKLRPTGQVLADLMNCYSNLTIAKLCRVSEMAVRKWLKRDGIVRSKRVVVKDLTETQLALLRADLRTALVRQEAKTGKAAGTEDNPDPEGDAVTPELRSSRSA